MRVVNWNSHGEDMPFFIHCDFTALKSTSLNMNILMPPLLGRQCVVGFTQFDNYFLLSSFQSVSFTRIIDAATLNLHLAFKKPYYICFLFSFSSLNGDLKNDPASFLFCVLL